MPLSLKKLLFAKQFRSVVSAIVGLIVAYFIASSTLGKVVEMNVCNMKYACQLPNRVDIQRRVDAVKLHHQLVDLTEDSIRRL